MHPNSHWFVLTALLMHWHACKLACLLHQHMHACLQDCFRLYAYALFIQLILYTVYLIHYWQVPYHTPLRDVIQRTFEIIVHAAPPGVPTVLLFSSASHIGRFRQQGIIVHEPDRLKSAGETQICLFDKTGTLTGSSVSTTTSSV